MGQRSELSHRRWSRSRIAFGTVSGSKLEGFPAFSSILFRKSLELQGSVAPACSRREAGVRFPPPPVFVRRNVANEDCHGVARCLGEAGLFSFYEDRGELRLGKPLWIKTTTSYGVAPRARSRTRHGVASRTRHDVSLSRRLTCITQRWTIQTPRGRFAGFHRGQPAAGQSAESAGGGDGNRGPKRIVPQSFPGGLP